MRLIDADRFKSYIDCGHLRPPTEVCFSEFDVCNMIDKQPTIETVQGVGRYEKAMQKLQEMPKYLNDVKVKQIKKVSFEAVRGEWIRKGKEINDCDGHRAFYWYECDQCGSRPPRNEFTKQEWLSNFCPNCGARMRREDGEA